MAEWLPWSELKKSHGTNKSSDIDSMLPEFAEMLQYFEKYPDKFVDYISNENTTFKLHDFQRLYLRVMARNQRVYITATRGTSKSFMNIFHNYLRCIFLPNFKCSIVAPMKEQASQIAQQNIEAIWTFLPSLKDELSDNKGISFEKDYTRLNFRNGARLDIVSASQGSRGLRRHSLSFEEICKMDSHREIIGEVLLPLLADNRKGSNGKVNKDEIHKQLLYVTTASNRQSYAWEVLNETMIDMALGHSAFAIGNDVELPIMFEQLEEDYVDRVRSSSSVSPLAFAREYMSVWTGDSEGSLVTVDDIQRARTLKKAELVRTDKEAKIILAVDVSRSERANRANTVMSVLKAIPRANGEYSKFLVNMITYNGDKISSAQAEWIKRHAKQYDADMVLVDGNGVGSSVIDELIKGGNYPPYAVVNDKDYDKYRTPDALPILWNFRSNTKDTLASDIDDNFQVVMQNGDLKMLVDSYVVKLKMMGRKSDDMEAKTKQLLPFLETDMLEEEIMNLRFTKTATGKTKVERVSRELEKDRYSSLSYGLYYIKLLEQENMKKNKRTNELDTSAFTSYRKPSYKA